MSKEMREQINRVKNWKHFIKEQYDEDENEHQGMWLHGGTGSFKGGNFLYVTDELKEALHYARLKGGNVYKLKDEYNHIVDWAMGQSEGMISQENLMNNGGFDNVFELFIDLKESGKYMKYEIVEKCEGKLPIHIVSNRSFNELELLAEDLECIKMWLNDKNIPTHDKDNNQYSVIGRIELLLNGC